MRMVGWLVATALAVTVAFFLVGPERVWRLAFGSPDLGRQHLESLQRTGRPNDALFVPAGDARPDAEAIAPFAVDADTLYSTLIGRIDATGRVAWVERDPATRYARALTWSPVMRFPDTNHIWVVPLGEDRSALYLYAAAKLGHSDLGKNRERLAGWLGLLDDLPRVR